MSIQAYLSRPYGSPPSAKPTGSKGRPAMVTTNAFAVTSLPGPSAWHIYDVVISQPGAPDLTARKTSDSKKHINIQKALDIMYKLQLSEPNIFQHRAAYDGNKLLFSPRQLHFAQGTTEGRFAVNLSENKSKDDPKNKAVFFVSIKHATSIDTGFLNRITGGQARPDDSRIAISMMQVLIRQHPMNHGPKVYNARSVFMNEGKRPTNSGFDILRGIFQSVRPTLGKFIINADLTSAFVYKEMPVDHWVQQFLGRRDLRDLNQLTPNNPAWKHLKAALKNIRVTTTIPQGSANKRSRPIRDIIPRVGSYEFDAERQGQATERLTVRDYFRRAHRYDLKYPDGLGLVFGSSQKPIIVPAEVCVIEKGQLFRKALTPDQTSEMLNFSKFRPDQRLERIQEIVRGNFLNYDQSDFLQRSGMRIAKDAMTVKGRLLDEPNMLYKDGRQVRTQQRGVWNSMGHQLHTPSPVKTVWAIIDFARSNAQDVQSFSSKLMEKCRTLGMMIPPAPRFVTQGNPDNPARTLDEAKATGDVNIILVILPNNAPDTRKGVKIWGDCVTGMVTQCIKQQNTRRSGNQLDQFCANVALKINAKMGGVNCVPRYEIAKKIQAIPTIVVGADVGHPGPGVADRPSITSLVASHDPHLSKYHAFTKIQPPRMEIIEGLATMVEDALNAFAQRNRVPPQRMIFYRDGVSEGEFETVSQFEIAAVQEGWKRFLERNKNIIVQMRLNLPDQIPLTFVIVGKRHHIRFFPGKDSNLQDRSGNVPGGLVVDTDIVAPIGIDFYLQSHSGLLGTSRSAHYTVLQDTNGFSIDDLQELSYYLCYSYARATRAVSIPAPVYYADLVCTRARYFFQDEAAYSEGGSGSINMDEWRRLFVNINPQVNKNGSMFFM